ncbi:hypothetical protein [Candidatus Halobonum tyrrellensis]|uniref:Uncharacterized protein n=1 Tax=Candidatus Halobonum tyrrellensis G22 TaxID=1324957 RepID=V4IW11_9EURY|nr:hypothetical protein [Candidatus Halobonum tyrrellensis]ESP87342.1 hypothetical protein K933_14688 [Candidatus Halobonum tyrrellensis G22]
MPRTALLASTLFAAAVTCCGFAAARAGVPSPLPAGFLWAGALVPAVHAARVVARDGGGAPGRWLVPALGPPLGMAVWAAYALASTPGTGTDSPTWLLVAAYGLGAVTVAGVGAAVGALLRRVDAGRLRGDA